MHIFNKLLRPLGVRIVRERRPRFPKVLVDPLERNKRTTLDQLWDDSAFKDHYEQEHRPFYDSLYEIIVTRGLFKDAQSIIDVGCGPGYFLAHIDQAGFAGELSGCDFSESAISSAAQNCPRAELFLHDVYQPLKKSYDVLTCMETLEHLLHPVEALRNFLSASRLCIITVPEGRKDSFRGHINFWSLESWEVFCQDSAGSRKCTVQEFNNARNLVAVFT
jgi:SAM-dependent methyltransferase